jgi:hypothetical protein
MQKINLKEMLSRFADKTSDLNSDLETIDSIDMSKMTASQKEEIFKNVERIESLTAKAENILKKTVREGLPILIQKQEERLENDLKQKQEQEQKAEVKPSKPRKSNLMKPTLANNYKPQDPKKTDK